MQFHLTINEIQKRLLAQACEFAYKNFPEFTEMGDDVELEMLAGMLADLESDQTNDLTA